MTINLLPPHTKEKRPRPSLTTVIHKLQNLNGGIPEQLRPRKLRHQLAQSHHPRHDSR
jgi:hypothetical protein